jgi:hypothetical protein
MCQDRELLFRWEESEKSCFEKRASRSRGLTSKAAAAASSGVCGTTAKLVRKGRYVVKALAKRKC